MQSEAGKMAQHVNVPEVKAVNLGLILGPHMVEAELTESQELSLWVPHLSCGKLNTSPENKWMNIKEQYSDYYHTANNLRKMRWQAASLS